eukprot:TRINITY_DN2393_c0_g10_i1.p1 TRINITY_DN2393_c0_g10~~TRINITY_DN2393_c0_g10_i1.p1  ORF type:complete len:237 (+),score=82.49 TRINITY_DN2393_c0_g10_i1:153-863(+)
MEPTNTPEKSKQAHTIKVVFVGAKNVGKTSIINRFHKDEFAEEYSATVGIDLVTKSIKFGNTTVKVQLWDTAGQERFRCLIPSYIKKADAVVMVYDVTAATTFQEMEYWIGEVNKNKAAEVVIVAVGNKLDMAGKREVTTEEGMEFAKGHNVTFVEASAKTGDNIPEIFNHIVSAFVEPVPEAPEQHETPQAASQPVPQPTVPAMAQRPSGITIVPPQDADPGQRPPVINPKCCQA